MIGIKFRIDNEYNTIFDKILRGVDSIEYHWYIFEDEVYVSSGESLFDRQKYGNQDFKKIISTNNYYPVFATIQLYLKNEKVSEIEDYQQFVNSNCELILFITDNEFVEVYAKEQKILKIIYQNAVDNSYFDIKIIDDPKDVKNNFSAYSD